MVRKAIIITIIVAGLLAIAIVPTVIIFTGIPYASRRVQQGGYNGGLTSALEELHHALETMQQTYFELWIGTWPTCIDWTAAVMGTHVSASLYSLTRSLDYDLPPGRSQPASVTAEGQRIENEINKYFSQAVAYYFGQDAFSLRTQAYDDMLWVVLGWLENVRFIHLHTDAHYPTQGSHSWYGKQFTAAFSHRARIFYELAKKGWDEKDCGGGMNWNPRLQPYKNAITNELFISAAIAMYLHFPGDNNGSPFVSGRHADQYQQDMELLFGSDTNGKPEMKNYPIARAHDPEYLRSAIKAYDWLSHSGMMNEDGLYIDGFHISYYPGRDSGVCDQRSNMIYTYNQGVILSGLRGLWESTGHEIYLEDGHRLVRNVIKATGYDLATQTPGPGKNATGNGGTLGRNGIMEEHCDSTTSCSQDGQNFKGIFFHHLTLFCESLPRTPLVPGLSYTADPTLYSLHQQSCKEYAKWVTRNAVAALETRDEHGRFGMWWGDDGHGLRPRQLPHGVEDYRNYGLGDEKKWGRGWEPGFVEPNKPESGFFMDEQSSLGAIRLLPRVQKPLTIRAKDSNDGGRGRTVETQGSGVAVVRAMWEFVFEHADAATEEGLETTRRWTNL